MKNLTANRLSFMLTAVLGLLICLLVGGSIFAASLLQRQSENATHAEIDAEVSAGAVSRLEDLKKYLADNADSIQQTRSLTQGLGTYDQNTIVATINGYAGKAGVTVSGFDFGSPAPTAATVGVVAAAAADTVNVTLASPLPYTNFIAFLKLLEQGKMPAQITTGGVSAGSTDASQISVNQLTIKVVE